MRRILVILLAAIALTALGLWILRTRASQVEFAESAQTLHETKPLAMATALDSPAPREAQGATAPNVGESGSESSKGSVRGRFVSQSNAPIAGVEVTRSMRKRQTQSMATSGDDGRFRFEVGGFSEVGRLGLNLVGTKRPYVPARFEAVAKKGEELDVGDLVMKLGGSVSGRAVDVNGLGVEDARISCTEPGVFDRELAPRFGPALVIAETKSRAGGEFTLEGASPGRVRMWASKTAMRHAMSEPIEVRAGEETSGVVLVLEPRTSADDLEIQVLEPDGSPCPGANIDFSRYSRAKGGGAGNSVADEQGHLSMPAMPDCTYRFLAADPKGLFGPASLNHVMPGSGPIVLRLVERISLVLRVIDELGAAVEHYRVRVVDPQSTTHDVGARIREEQHANGTIDLAVPAVPFVVTVDAEGFELANFGPYEPGAVPSAIEAKLVRLHDISGRVTAAGKPIAGAKVELYQAAPDMLAVTVNEFASRYTHSYPTAESESRDDGAFHLTLRKSGQYFLVAIKTNWASVELGPLDLDPKIGAHDLVLELTAGGAIEGRVLVPAGESPGGSVIGISRGDSTPRTIRVASDGAFRFEHLTPGRWLVKRCEREISEFAIGESQDLTSEPVKIPWNCEVFEGALAHFDIDLRVERTVKLVGRLTLGGKPANQCRVFLQTSDAATLASQSVETNANGEFELVAQEPGNYRFGAHGTLGASTEMDLTDRVELSKNGAVLESRSPCVRPRRGNSRERSESQTRRSVPPVVRSRRSRSDHQVPDRRARSLRDSVRPCRCVQNPSLDDERQTRCRELRRRRRRDDHDRTSVIRRVRDVAWSSSTRSSLPAAP